MSDYLLRLQDALISYEGLPLVIAGVIACLAGLFLWLGGTRFAGLVLGVTGGAVGAVLGLLASHWLEVQPSVSALIGAAVLALASILLKKVVIILLATLIFTCIAGATFLGNQMNDSGWRDKINEIRDQAQLARPLSDTDEPASASLQRRLLLLQQYQQTAALTGSEAEQARGKLQTLWAEFRYALGEHRTGVVLWAILGGAIGLALAYLVMKMMMALCFSLVGATSVIAGVSLILFARHTPVITHFMNRPRVLPILFIGMVLLGVIVQLVISRQPKKAAEDENKKDEDKK